MQWFPNSLQTWTFFSKNLTIKRNTKPEDAKRDYAETSENHKHSWIGTDRRVRNKTDRNL